MLDRKEFLDSSPSKFVQANLFNLRATPLDSVVPHSSIASLTRRTVGEMSSTALLTRRTVREMSTPRNPKITQILSMLSIQEWGKVHGTRSYARLHTTRNAVDNGASVWIHMHIWWKCMTSTHRHGRTLLRLDLLALSGLVSGPGEWLED